MLNFSIILVYINYFILIISIILNYFHLFLIIPIYSKSRELFIFNLVFAIIPIVLIMHFQINYDIYQHNRNYCNYSHYSALLQRPDRQLT